MERYNLKYTGPEMDNILDNANNLSGIIVMWSGAVDKIPTGWALCDGTNGTPNLVNRFIVGAGSSYAVGATGGSDSVTLTTAQMPSHNHTASTSVTIQSGGAHTHTVSVPAESSNLSVNNFSTDAAVRGTEKVTTSSAGSHKHTATASTTISSTGSGSAHENRPPYYALAYIMKL